MKKASTYFNSVGVKAFEKGIGIDIFCGGRSPNLGIPALLNLVKPTGGYVLSHLSFLEEQFAFNIKFVMTETQMSRSTRGYSGGDIIAMANGNQMNTLNGCVLDLQMPR